MSGDDACEKSELVGARRLTGGVHQPDAGADHARRERFLHFVFECRQLVGVQSGSAVAGRGEPCRAMPDLSGNIGGRGAVVERLQPAGDIAPGPFQIRSDIDRADDPRQAGDIGVARCRRHTAVADHFSGDALGDPALVVRVGEQAEVGVAVQVHEAWGDDATGAVDGLRVVPGDGTFARRDDGGDPVRRDHHIAEEGLTAEAVGDEAAAQHGLRGRGHIRRRPGSSRRALRGPWRRGPPPPG